MSLKNIECLVDGNGDIFIGSIGRLDIKLAQARYKEVEAYEKARQKGKQ